MADVIKTTLFDLDIDGQKFHLFDGGGEIEITDPPGVSRTYSGIGVIGEVVANEENVEPAARTLEFTLDGLDVGLLTLAIADTFQYGEIAVRVATFDYPAMTLRKIFSLFDGYISHIQVAHDHANQTGALIVSCFTELQNQNLSAELRYTDKSQRRRDKDDTAFTRLPEGANDEVVWGRGDIR